MFRRLANRLASAVNVSDEDNSNVRQLEAMGFPLDLARRTLSQCNGNVEHAAEVLLAGSQTTTSTALTHDRTSDVNAASLQAALTESLQSEDQRLFQLAQQESLHSTTLPARAVLPPITDMQRNSAQSAAAVRRAGTAAHQRSGATAPPIRSNSGGLSTHHPNVTIPKPLDSKSKEEQIVRSADRLKTHSMAVDTLHKALVTIQANPEEEKYRRIDTNHPGYQRSVAGAPGSAVFLSSMGFQQRPGGILVLPREHVDNVVLYLGISSLEQVKLSNEYKEHKSLVQFEKDYAAIVLESNSSTEAAITRSTYMQQLPSEPMAGTGALVQIKITDVETFKRRFDGDDTLQDVLHWLGGHAPGILDNLDSNKWSLVDLNRYPATPIDIKYKDRTLQSIGCWPSGKLQILPSSND
jgi:hypothetical protein